MTKGCRRSHLWATGWKYRRSVTKEQIAALRKELASHPGSFVETDLHAIPDDANLPVEKKAGAQTGRAPASAQPRQPSLAQNRRSNNQSILPAPLSCRGAKSRHL